MPYYETVFILRQDISATQVETVTDSMAEVITGDSGKIARREYWGLKSMAYRMKKNKKGHYVLLNYDAPIETVREVERLMGLHEDVLRVLTLRTDDLPEEPSVVMANRNERGGRYSRDRPDKPRDQEGGKAKPVAAAAETKTEPAKPETAAAETKTEPAKPETAAAETKTEPAKPETAAAEGETA